MAAKKAIVLASDGMHEQLQSGDTLEGAGGGTPAGATGEIQYNNAGDFAANSIFKFVPDNGTTHKNSIILGFPGSTETEIAQKSTGLEISMDSLKFTNRAGDYFSLDATGRLTIYDFANDIYILDSSAVSGLNLESTGGTISLSPDEINIYGNAIINIIAGTATTTNTIGYTLNLSGGNSKGNKGSSVDISTAVAGTSGSTRRLSTKHFSFNELSFIHQYDSSNYWTATIASTGGMTWQGVGIGGAITLSPTSGQNINLKPASTGKATFGDGGVTDYAEFDATGALKFNGAATIWDDVLPTTFLQLTGNAAPNITLVGASSHLRAQEFANSSANEEFLPVWQIPHKWKAESAIVPHLHIYVPDDGTGGDIVFGMYYTWTNTNGTSAAETGPIYATLTRAANAGINANAIISFGSIAGTGKTFSSIFRAKIYRVQAGADTFGGTCWLLSGDIHVEIDKLGTNNELS